jgi:hypothetical protein
LVTYSETFSDSSWTKLGAGTGSTAVVTSDYAISPDGTQNATRLVCDLNGGGGSVSNQSLIYDLYSSSGDQSLSIYVKSNTGSNQTIYFANTQTSGDTIIATNEWQRFTFSHSTTNYVFAVGLRGRTGGAIDDTADILIWAGQAEAGSYATSYIPTSGSTVTRVKDQYSKTGISDKIGQTEGSIYFEFKQNQLQSYTQRILTLYSDSANLIEIQLTSSNELVFVSVKTGESAVVITKSNAITLGSVTKISAGYKAGDFVFYVNGVQAGTDTDSSKTIPQMDNLLFSRYNSTAPFIGSINSLKLYKTRLTNTQLEELTT